MNLNIKIVDRIIENALEEDIGRGDITSFLTIQDNVSVNYQICAREEMVVCGVAIVKHVFDKVSVDKQVVHHKDGEVAKAGDRLISGTGNAKDIFAVERVGLNILQHMSGIATLTNKFVKQVKGTKAKILDTRKTIPGIRELQKYAVRIGGGYNHRFRLDDGILIKDNHIAVCGSVSEALKRARNEISTVARTRIEIECDNLDQVKEAYMAGADIIMLDNMPINDIKQAVKIVEGKVPLEVSGGVNIDNIKQIAETGVDFISIGSLTHSVKSVDIGLDILKV